MNLQEFSQELEKKMNVKGNYFKVHPLKSDTKISTLEVSIHPDLKLALPGDQFEKTDLNYTRDFLLAKLHMKLKDLNLSKYCDNMAQIPDV